MQKRTKYTLKLFIINLFLLFPVNTYAQEAVPEKGLSIIPWAIKHCGSMPKEMIYGFAALAVLIISAVIYAVKCKGDKKDEK